MVGEELLPAWLLATFSLVHQLALLIQPRPLWLAIGYITHALRVKEVASSNQSPTTLAHQYTNHGNNTRQGLDLLWRKQRPLLWPAKLDQRRKHQRHLAALVHDRAPTVPARHLARQLVRVVFGAGAVKYKILGAVFKRHVGLFKDGGPLEGGAVKDLTAAAVAVFRSERALAGEVVAHATAVACSGPAGGECGLRG
jgi:hypothetical protein